MSIAPILGYLVCKIQQKRASDTEIQLTTPRYLAVPRPPHPHENQFCSTVVGIFDSIKVVDVGGEEDSK